MPSPFPGMNPYLEQPSAWRDFHGSLMPAMRDALAVQVLPRYFVKIEEHLFVHDPVEESTRPFGAADVAVSLQRPPRLTGTTTVLNPPFEVELPGVDTSRISRLEIRDRHDRQLITVIELLSPTNKYSGPNRDQYLAKRRQVLASWVNLVEIDLLRGGPRMPATTFPDCDYCILVSRFMERPRAGLWAFGLRDPLPVIPIPLRPSEDDAQLDIQPLLHRIYDNAGYGYFLYDHAPTPPLSPEDAAWANQLLPPPPA